MSVDDAASDDAYDGVANLSLDAITTDDDTPAPTTTTPPPTPTTPPPPLGEVALAVAPSCSSVTISWAPGTTSDLASFVLVTKGTRRRLGHLPRRLLRSDRSAPSRALLAGCTASRYWPTTPGRRALQRRQRDGLRLPHTPATYDDNDHDTTTYDDDTTPPPTTTTPHHHRPRRPRRHDDHDDHDTTTTTRPRPDPRRHDTASYDATFYDRRATVPPDTASYDDYVGTTRTTSTTTSTTVGRNQVQMLTTTGSRTRRRAPWEPTRRIRTPTAMASRTASKSANSDLTRWTPMTLVLAP
ncbi:MAG: hypothetical protein Ct9H300mP31_14450 [Acidimicrobiaceae bacterium]|nr:MAG: hypothetical protein Ct9H300mP31_14450 [Acidimicrobiaceae bacterium]